MLGRQTILDCFTDDVIGHIVRLVIVLCSLNYVSSHGRQSDREVSIVYVLCNIHVVTT